MPDYHKCVDHIAKKPLWEGTTAQPFAYGLNRPKFADRESHCLPKRAFVNQPILGGQPTPNTRPFVGKAPNPVGSGRFIESSFALLTNAVYMQAT